MVLITDTDDTQTNYADHDLCGYSFTINFLPINLIILNSNRFLVTPQVAFLCLLAMECAIPSNLSFEHYEIYSQWHQ